MNKEAAVESTRPEELIRPTDETSAWREPLGSRFESKVVPAVSQRPILDGTRV